MVFARFLVSTQLPELHVKPIMPWIKSHVFEVLGKGDNFCSTERENNLLGT
jgi:hypothetical protein